MRNRISVFVVVFVFLVTQLYAQQNPPPAAAAPAAPPTPAAAPAPAQAAATTPAAGAPAAANGAVAAPVADNTGVDLSKYKKVMIDDFENAELWEAEIPRDSGIVVSEKKDGGPKDVKNDQNKYVLGVKVSFFRTGSSGIGLKPARPVIIQDVVKGFSVWTVGRGFPNELKVLFREPVAREFRMVSLGRLSFYGWQKLETPISSNFESQSFDAYFKRTPGAPSEAPTTTSPFTADDIRFFTSLPTGAGDLREGTEIDALYIQVAPEAAKGVYYSYFDNFEASVDTGIKDSLDQIDNQLDAW